MGAGRVDDDGAGQASGGLGRAEDGDWFAGPQGQTQRGVAQAAMAGEQLFDCRVDANPLTLHARCPRSGPVPDPDQTEVLVVGATFPQGLDGGGRPIGDRVGVQPGPSVPFLGCRELQVERQAFKVAAQPTALASPGPSPPPATVEVVGHHGERADEGEGGIPP